MEKNTVDPDQMLHDLTSALDVLFTYEPFTRFKLAKVKSRPLLDGFCKQRNQTGSGKSCLPLKKYGRKTWRKRIPIYHKFTSWLEKNLATLPLYNSVLQISRSKRDNFLYYSFKMYVVTHH